MANSSEIEIVTCEWCKKKLHRNEFATMITYVNNAHVVFHMECYELSQLGQYDIIAIDKELDKDPEEMIDEDGNLITDEDDDEETEEVDIEEVDIEDIEC